MLNVWSENSGYDFGTYNEREVVTLPLPILPGVDQTTINVSVISGKLPGGMRIIFIEGSNIWAIKGSPLEVSRTTESTFVLRASNGNDLNDRTFTMSIQGADAPVWVTPEGSLPIGASTLRLSNIAKISRTDNIVTITTELSHNFVTGNYVTVNSTIDSVNMEGAELFQPLVIPGETEEEYNYRIVTTITYYKYGPDIPETVANGTITLETTPLTFVLDNAVIDFQLQAVDTDLTSSNELEYFIADGDGLVPPGLTLDRDGRIHGIVDPILTLDLTARTGFYDTNLFDTYPYDFGDTPNISDTDYYDVVTPKKLNRNYEFIVSVSDGETITKRKFLIFVVGDDFLRADNMSQPVGTNAFTADATYLRAPVWLTAANLGLRRANNYVTILLDTYDPNPNIGPVGYSLASYNPDLTESVLPDGVFLDPDNGEIFGFVPYQPAVTKEYNFTITATKYDKEDLTYVEVAIVVGDDALVGQNFLKISPLDQESIDLIIGDVIRIGPTVYTITEYVSNSVTGGTLATLKLAENLVTNVIDGLEIRKQYLTSTAEYTKQTSSKTFTLGVLGEVDSVIAFTSDEDLGALRPNYPSNLHVEAVTSVPNAQLRYTLVSGTLPPGLELRESGIIIGTINQFRAGSISGFTLFDNGTTTFDGGTTTVDKIYKFTINAQDQFKFSSINKEFYITVGTNDLTLYSNISCKPLPKIEKRELFFNFINDTSIFTPDSIYRLGDPSFGLQKELKMLVYAGIESKTLPEYVAALSKNAKRKRYRLGDVKKAVAKYQGTNEVVYEILYIEVLDNYENKNGSVKSKIRLPVNVNSPELINQTRMNTINGKLGTYNNGNTTYENAVTESSLNRQAVDRFQPNLAPMTIDNRNINISSKDLEYVYPASLKNIRDNLAEVGLTENYFLPLWMTTPQDNRTAATGYIKAIPLCYCNPGEGDVILENIENSGFDFTQLDYEIDRFVIDSDINTVSESYLKFNNYRYNI